MVMLHSMSSHSYYHDQKRSDLGWKLLSGTRTPLQGWRVSSVPISTHAVLCLSTYQILWSLEPSIRLPKIAPTLYIQHHLLSLVVRMSNKRSYFQRTGVRQGCSNPLWRPPRSRQLSLPAVLQQIMMSCMVCTLAIHTNRRLECQYRTKTMPIPILSYRDGHHVVKASLRAWEVRSLPKKQRSNFVRKSMRIGDWVSLSQHKSAGLIFSHLTKVLTT